MPSWAKYAPEPEPKPGQFDLRDMPSAQREQFVEQARVQRLISERRQVAEEIQQGPLFDPGTIGPAVELLTASAPNTWSDNADRICQAFALVDGRFAAAYQQQREGKFAPAAQAFQAMLSDKDTSYFAAAKRFCYTQSLEQSGRKEEAAEAYLELAQAMPDRTCFASLALLAAGKNFEAVNRRYKAMGCYKAWIDSFGMLDESAAQELAGKVKEIAAQYERPLHTLAGQMTQVQARLGQVDGGQETQTQEHQIASMLEDLIATSEEQSSSSSSSSGQKPEQKQEQKKDSSEGKSGQSNQPSPPSSLTSPSSAARAAKLVLGQPPRPEGLSEARPSDGTDDWGKLPPRERQQLLETFKESMNERYRDMLRDYYKGLAEQKK